MVSGCAQKGEPPKTTPLKINETLLKEKGWEEVKAWEETRIYKKAMLTFNVSITTVQYSDVSLARKIYKQTLGMIDEDFAQIYVTKIDTSNIWEILEPIYVPIDKVMDEAEKSLKERARLQYGIELRKVSVTSITVNGHEAKVRILEGDFHYKDMGFEAFNRTFVIPGGDLPIMAYIIGWDCPESDSKIVVVTMYPNQNIEKVVSADLTEAIHVEISIRLDFNPQKEYDDIMEMIRSIDCH